MAGIDFVLLRRQLSLTQVLDLIGFTPTMRCGLQLCVARVPRSPPS
jgi:hypothetical protein